MTALEDVVRRLGCAEESERICAAQDLGYLNVADGVPYLLRRLPGERSDAVRGAIFHALTRMNNEAAAEGAIALLNSDDPFIRNHAVEVLRHKGGQALPFLKHVARAADRDARKFVQDVLSPVRPPGAEEIHAAALYDDDLNVVITAVENAGRIHAVELRPRIEVLLGRNSHPMLTAACVEALVEIGCEESFMAISRQFPKLAVLPDYYLRPCLKAAAAWGTPVQFNEVASLLSVKNSHLRPQILAALMAIRQRWPAAVFDDALLPRLCAVVEDGDAALCRYEAVRVLGFWAAREDIHAFLVTCLAHSERMVRLAAAESLRASARSGLPLIFQARAAVESDEEVLQALNC